MLGFSAVILSVAIGGMAWVIQDAKATQRARTAAENEAHATELLLHLERVAGDDAAIRDSAAAIERVRTEMFRELDYHSLVRVRVLRGDKVLYNSQPQLPDALPLYGSPEAQRANGWVRAVERDDVSKLVVERSHEVDDGWMLSLYGISFLQRSTVFSLPLLLLPAWLIVGIGLRPLRSIAQEIEQRTASDLTPLADSKYRELSPLVMAINHLMARLRQRIEHEREFLTDAAHELKTPLAAIQLNAHLLQGSAEPSQRNADVSAGLREGVARATHLVHQLLALERARAEPDAEPPPLTALDAIVRDRLAMAAPLALQRDIDIEFQSDGDCVRPVHLESMAALLDNLISNAIKYTPSAGRIHVRLQGLAPGACCRLTIADQGPGIAPELRQKVFERFYRIPGQEATGSGLGLAIAERAAHRNQAVISLADGEGGKGLVATVAFQPAA